MTPWTWEGIAGRGIGAVAGLVVTTSVLGADGGLAGAATALGVGTSATAALNAITGRGRPPPGPPGPDPWGAPFDPGMKERAFRDPLYQERPGDRGQRASEPPGRFSRGEAPDDNPYYRMREGGGAPRGYY